MKIYERKRLTSIEGLILRKLCMSQYQENILFKKSAPFYIFMSEMKSLKINLVSIREILNELIEIGGLQLHKTINGEKYYFINQDILWELLRKDQIFMLDEKIMNDKYLMMEK